MGLEMVDIVIQTENAFGISIVDEDMFNIATVGQYYDYVAGKLSGTKSTKCLSSVIFYRLRRAFGDCLDIQRSEFKPDTNLDSLLPSKSRERIWSDLAAASDLTFPPLVHPQWVWSIMTAGAGGFVIAALLSHYWLFLFGAVAFPVAVYCLTIPLATCVPSNMRTVRFAVETLLQKNIGRLVEREQTWNPEEVWVTLVGIIANSLKIDPKEVTKEAHFYNDLGAG